MGRSWGCYPIELESPYWQETADLVAAIEARFGLLVVVLRLLAADRPRRVLEPPLRDFVPVQQRSWSLSTLWRLESPRGQGTLAWLKQVPHFFGHEGALLDCGSDGRCREPCQTSWERVACLEACGVARRAAPRRPPSGQCAGRRRGA